MYKSNYLCIMASALEVNVKQSVNELKALYKTVPAHHKQKVQMLLIMKQSDSALTKNELASLVGVNHNSIQTWRKRYVTGGIDVLLSDGRIGFKPSLLTKKQHAKILVQITNPKDAFTSFKELQTWANSTFNMDLNYNSLRHYVKRNFGAKMKVARKSHINKDEQAVDSFKKSSVKDANPSSNK